MSIDDFESLVDEHLAEASKKLQEFEDLYGPQVAAWVALSYALYMLSFAEIGIPGITDDAIALARINGKEINDAMFFREQLGEVPDDELP